MKKYFEIEPRTGRWYEEVIPLRHGTCFARDEEYIAISHLDRSVPMNINGDEITLTPAMKMWEVAGGEGPVFAILNRHGVVPVREMTPRMACAWGIYHIYDEVWHRGGRPPMKAIVEAPSNWRAYEKFNRFWYNGVPEVIKAAISVYHKEHGSMGRLKAAVRALD